MARDNFNYLLDMPDVPSNFAYLMDPDPLEGSAFAEYVPVDDFFDKYLAQLDFSDVGSPSAGMAKGARIEAQPRESQSADLSDGTTHQAGSDYSKNSRSNSQAALPDHNSSSGSPPIQLESTAAGTNTDAMQPTSGLPRQPQPQAQRGSPLPPLPNTISSGVVTTGIQGSSAAPVGLQPIDVSGSVGGSNAIVSGIPDLIQDRQAPKAPGKRKRARDDRQQLLNKLAQIRYRERKRTKADTLQEQVTVLEASLADMRLKQTEAADLTKRNRDIEAKLAALSGPQGGADAVVRLQASGRASAAAPLPRDSQDELGSLVKQWLAKSKEIKDLVALIGLGSSNQSSLGRLRNDMRRSVQKRVSPKTRDLLAHVELRMATMVSDVTKLCMRVMRLQGVQVEQLMVADYDMLCSLKGWKDEGKWLRAAKAVDLTTKQRNKVLVFREQALECLHGLYEERRQLNERVVADVEPMLFTPAASSCQATNTAAVDMLRVLEALAVNLAAEQQELARQDWVLFRELLSPVQAGVLVAASFPDHCDAMALMNATAQLTSSQPLPAGWKHPPT